MKIPNRYALMLLSLGFVGVYSCTKTTTLTVTNDLPIARSFETLSVSAGDLKLPSSTTLELYGIRDDKGEEQPVQYVDTDDDGRKDVLLFQPIMAPTSERRYVLFEREGVASEKEPTICYSRFVPERTDDYAWENDKVAFRMFGPVAQKMYEDGVQGGTLTSGVDCWLKRVEYPIIDKWYKKYTERTGSYHEDTGEGLDNFHVGSSRGCGGITIQEKEGGFAVPKNFTHYKTLMNGPIRTQFQLGYETWLANGKPVDHTLTITLDRGSNLSKVKVDISGTQGFWTGLTLHEKDGEITKGQDAPWISYWQPHGDSELGTALLAAPKVFDGYSVHEVDEADASHAFLKLHVVNGSATYFTGFGWKKSNLFQTKEDWNKYLDTFSQCIESPMKVEVH
ncbi:MAG: DUF4861 family protein [Flavobacteriaceae bacterium]